VRNRRISPWNDHGDDEIGREAFDQAMGDNEPGPLRDQIEEADDDDADGHLVSPGILDQAKK
jgi:hypothetical protein